MLVARGSERRLAADESCLKHPAHSIKNIFGQRRTALIVIPAVGADVHRRRGQAPLVLIGPRLLFGFQLLPLAASVRWQGSDRRRTR